MQILVSAPFTLNLGGGEQRRFDAGVHEVDKEVAEHWYVKAHSRHVSKAKDDGAAAAAKKAADEAAAKAAAEKEAADKAEAEKNKKK